MTKHACIWKSQCMLPLGNLSTISENKDSQKYSILNKHQNVCWNKKYSV